MSFKKFMAALAIIAGFSFSVIAQIAPQKMNYQGIARGLDDRALMEQEVSLRIRIISENDLDRPVYAEEHKVTTNKLGLFTLIIGAGEPLEGTMRGINWGSAAHYLSIQMDIEGDGSFQAMGISQLLTVPYAFYAERAGGIDGSNSRDIPFAGIQGQTIHHNGTDWVATLNLFNDGTTVSTDADALLNGITVGRGGGSVGSNTASGLNALYTNTTGLYNTAFGREALYSNSTGSYNTANGIGALFSNTTGSRNTANGVGALYSNTTGYRNTANGFDALYSNTSGWDNTATGNNALYSNTIGHYNTANGKNALFANTTGSENTAFGYFALYQNTTGSENTANTFQALYSNTTGSQNTANGKNALFSNTSGNQNTANGKDALFSNTTGNYNTANGVGALKFNTTGYRNTANGRHALHSNTVGWDNTASGNNALYSNTLGSENTANGKNALFSNTTGSGNTANGYFALYQNTSGSENSANAFQALYSNTSGSRNTAIGKNALFNNTTGWDNTANGYYALYWNTTGTENSANTFQALYRNTTGNQNTANGYNALFSNTTGNRNTALGYLTDVSSDNLSNATAIGAQAVVNASNKIRLGNALVTVIEGQVAYSFPSDGRFKYNISESDVKGLDFIMKLKPLVYNFDNRKFEEFLAGNMTDSIRQKHFENSDFSISTSMRQSGFIAQDVEQAMKEAGYDFNGVHRPQTDDDNYSVSYSLFVVPLVKAVQEQQQTIEELKKENESLGSRLEKVEQMLKKMDR